jgi:NADH-quinone oxidoreductase subunit N
VLLRVLFGANTSGWFWLLWISAVLSMTLGNLGALVQDNVKRMLAYSSIAHAGYVLVAFVAGGDTGLTAAIFYTAAYAAMNVGAFAVVSHIGSGGERYTSIEDYAGLSRRSPLLAFTLTIFMLSLIGIPLTGGFFAKYYVFNAALKSNLIGLTIIGVLNSAVAAYYYLRLIVVMYMREPAVELPPEKTSPAMSLALVLAALATIYLGVIPSQVVDYASQGAKEVLTLPNPSSTPAAAVTRNVVHTGQ